MGICAPSFRRGFAGPVSDPPLVEVGHGGEHLARQIREAVLGPYEGHVAVAPGLCAALDDGLHEEVEEVAAVAHLQDEVEAVLLLEDLVELHDVRVVQHLHNVDLVAKRLELV